jgi:hypothetical protein
LSGIDSEDTIGAGAQEQGQPNQQAFLDFYFRLGSARKLQLARQASIVKARISGNGQPAVHTFDHEFGYPKRQIPPPAIARLLISDNKDTRLISE